MKKGMKYQHIDRVHPDYLNQQQVIRETCKELELIAFYPDYHGEERDKNTVLVYTPSDHIYNLELEKQGCWDTNKYRKPIFTFENSDANGSGDYGFANFGRLDLRGNRYYQVIKGAIRCAYYRHKQNDYIRSCGGILNIKEADETYNDLNRSILDAFDDQNSGETFIFSLFGEKAKEGLRKYESPVYNFDCYFVVPKYNEELDRMVKEIGKNKSEATYDKIMKKVEQLHGLSLVWF